MRFTGEIFNMKSGKSMKEQELFELADRICEPDQPAMQRAAARQLSLAKPPGSLGGLEDISVKMAGITGEVFNDIEKCCVAVFCADNGVAEEGISSAPQSVTMAQTVNFTRRLTGVGTLAKSFNSELLIVDMGVKEPIPKELYDDVPLRDTHKIIDRRIRPGTWNLAKGPAMTKEEAMKCIGNGIEMAKALADGGYDIIGIGEMGIGNTTTSSAILSAITGEDSDVTCGKGGGLNDAGFMRKKKIVDTVSAKYRACGGLLEMIKDTAESAAKHRRIAETIENTGVGKSLNDDARECMIDILSEMGGFDICAMAGAFIGAASCRLPVVVDGYISVVAALAASIIAPKSTGYMFASHKSYEKGYQLAMDILGLKPFLALDMRLGEGSGCPIAFEIIRGACDVMKNMATFEEAAINDDYLEEIRKGDCF